MSMQFKKTGLMLAVAFFLFGVGVERVDAGEKSVTWTSGTVPDLAYYWNWADGLGGNYASSGWATGLKQSIVNITYRAKVTNVTKGTVLSEGDTVSVGDQLKLEAVSSADSDISWFGQGWGDDSPYGHWRVDASAPAKTCESGDLVSTNRSATSWQTTWLGRTISGTMDGIYSIYVPLSVNPPSISYDTTGSTAGLSCSGQNCTVTSGGSIKANITFGSTSGKFYYRYSSAPGTGGNGVCYANNTAMRRIVSTYSTSYDNNSLVNRQISTTTLANPDNSDYILSVPSQKITFNLSAGVGNQPPTVPTISGPTTGVAGVAYDYSIVATDPDANSKMFFDLDFSNVNASTNGTADIEVPSGNGVVDSGVSAPFSRTFSSPGTYKMSGRAISFTSGNTAATRMVGAWSPEYTVTISAAVSGTCGSVNGTTQSSLSSTSSGLCGSGSVSGFTTNASTWTWSCNGNNGVNRSCSANIQPSPTLTLTANPENIQLLPGGSSFGTTNINWTSQNTTSCNVSCSFLSPCGGFTALSGTWGPWSLNPGTYGFSMTCYDGATQGTGRSITKSVSVVISPAPTLSFSASSYYVASGGSSNLTWTTTNVASCRATGTGWENKATSLSTTDWSTGPLVESKSYSLECFTGANFTGISTGIQTVTVSVRQRPTCGLAQGQSFATLGASTPNLCSGDTWVSASSISGGGIGNYFAWSCRDALTGQSSTTCSANKIANGVCGYWNGRSDPVSTSSNFGVAPNGVTFAAMCNTGSLSGFAPNASSTGWTWTCNGVNGATGSQSCAATSPCPLSPEDVTVTAPLDPGGTLSGGIWGGKEAVNDFGLGFIFPLGYPTPYSLDTDFSRAVVHAGYIPFSTPGNSQSILLRKIFVASSGVSGSTANRVSSQNKSGISCAAEIGTPGVCGPADGIARSTSPNTLTLSERCVSGVPSSVTSLSNRWVWECRGKGNYNYFRANCSAPKTQHSLRAHIECEPGFTCPGGVAGSVSWAGGYSGGDVTENGIYAQNTRSITATGSGYTFSRFAGDACTSTVGSTCDMTMDANKDVIAYFQPTSQPGICGSANGTTRPGLTSGSSDLCSSGAVDNFTSSGQRYEWTCAGMNGSTTNASCSAQQAIDLNWTEVQP